ncbi:PEP-CTERM sorting domain-containing protein [Zooshikella harenae]|uniref:PEP-CTERM sorting domain-containing protein n=1 Tax=Zooshikella harenae TaxID=2827238 RepID=A0ABS5ZFU0_9GAMM|nr:PEP-CTERM sorting domain-containing protein [Zooshikella harenae]MBU2712835.1 PEP-CTERM sorting domain-containing protein [Zooshikella harenae]
MKKIVSAVALAVCCIGSAHAGLLSVEGGVTTRLPGSHNPNTGETRPGMTVIQGANIKATAAVKLTYTYLGYEASWRNIFGSVGGTFINKTTAKGTEITEVLSDTGWLDFNFRTPKGTVKNGLNNSAGSFKPSFFVSYAGQNSYYIGLNDDGGSIDRDYDDMILKVTAVAYNCPNPPKPPKPPKPVPAPAPIVLLGLGLLGISLRKKK